MTNPRVSVIVPSYNHVRYVQTCIESILRQDYGNLELIVVDDGSRDGSRELLQDLRGSYKFVLVLQENRGLAAALNEGVRRSIGEYITACASDDYWLPGKIRRQVDFLDASPETGACATEVLFVDANGAELPRQRATPPGPRANSFEDFLLARYWFPTPSVMTRRDALTRVGGFDESHFIEDWPLWLKLSSAGYAMWTLPERLVAYRLHGANMHKRLPEMVADRQAILEEYRDHPLFSTARRVCRLRSFAELAVSHKTAAAQYVPELIGEAYADPKFWLALATLALPVSAAETTLRAVAAGLHISKPARDRAQRILARWRAPNIRD
jgi:alpha-1,3-rhamnosyltransferase